MRTDELAAKTTSSSCSTRFLFSRARKKTGRLFFITCIRDRQPMPPVVVVGRASFSFPPKILMWDNPHVASQLAAPVLSLFGIQATTSIRCSTFIISSEENNIRPPFEWKPVPTAFFLISFHVVGGCGRTQRPTEGKRRGKCSNSGNPSLETSSCRADYTQTPADAFVLSRMAPGPLGSPPPTA